MAKTKTKAKKAAKKTGVRQVIPMLRCEMEANLRTPHSTESSGHLATAYVTFTEKVAEWRAAVKAHRAAKGKAADMPQFNPKHFLDLNKGQMSQDQMEELDEREWNGESVVRLPRYNPVLIDAILASKPSVCIRRGAGKKKPPSNWDEKRLGSWYLLDEEDERTFPSGWFFDKKLPRRCHAVQAERMVTDAEKNILTFGNNRYVVGDGTNVRSALMLLLTTKRGNYRAGDLIRKRMSLAGNKDVTDIVFCIEDRPNNGGGVTLKAEWKNSIKEVVCLPGQAMSAGFLFDAKGKRLTAKQIRALDSDTKGLKFKTVRQVLNGPIVGKPIPWSAIWAELQVADKAGIAAMRKRSGRSEEYEKGSPQACSLENHKVTCRVGPHESHPHGFRAAMADVVPYKITGGDELMFGVVVGDRSNFPYEEVEEVEVVESSKKRKTRKTRKAESKKAAKPADAPPVDAAPPVEVDTADEVKEEITEGEAVEA